MYPMTGNGMLGQMQSLLFAPLTRFSQSTMIHKLLAAGVGGGIAYWLHKKGLSDTTVAVSALAGAYGASMAMNAPAVMGIPGISGPQSGMGMMHGALPSANVGQVAQASRVLTSMGVRPGALAPPQPAFLPAQTPAGNGQWAALG